MSHDATDRVEPASTARSGALIAVVTGLLPLASGLAIWELVGSPDSPFYPAPSSWWPALFERNQDEDILPAIVDTAHTFGLGLLVAIVAGGALGVGTGASARFDRALRPTFEFARALPPAALVPVATLLLGFDETMKVVVVAMAAIWPVLLNTADGVRRIDPLLIDSARSLHLSPGRTVVSVLLPSVTPDVVVGARVATPIALVITLLVEYLTGVNGLGALVGEAQRTFQPARVYVLIVIAALMSLVVNAGVRAVEDGVRRRRFGPRGVVG